MSLFKHRDVVNNIKSYINSCKDFILQPSGSLPIDSDITTRLTTVDIIVSKNNNISHIIEVETSTDGTTIAGKLILANEALKMMIDNESQSKEMRPKIIYLYKPGFNHFARVKYRARKIYYYLNFIDVPIIEYYTDDWYKYL